MTTNSNNEVKFPPINSRQNVPFKVPNDNDILLENQNSKSRNRDQKIWDKTTSSCRNALKRFDKFQTAVDDKYVPLNSFNNKQKKLIENAMEIIQMRKKNKDLVSKNETIVDILEQKKQMFLVTMTHGIIEKQITNLKSQAQERNKALKDSDQILTQDMEDFEQFRQKQSSQTKKIQQTYQKQVQKRLLKEQEIKNKQINFNSLRAEKSRNEQNISSYEKYKKFLHQLYTKEQLKNLEDERNKELAKLKEKMRQEWQNKQDSKKRNLKEEFEQIFKKEVEGGENEEIEEIMNKEEMFFKEPEQLIQLFNTLQQTNLFCIQNAQYAQQKYQQLSIFSEERKNQLTQKYKTQLEHKNLLQKQLLELENSIKVLKKKKQQNNILDGKDSKDIKSTIAGEYQNMKDIMQAYLPEFEQNTESLSLLSGIQICMQKLWEKLRECFAQNPKAIKEIRNAYEKKKTLEKREQTTRNNKIEEQKRKIRNLEKKQPTMKIHGRIAMVRSPPADKVVAKKVEVTGKDLDDDRKYFMQ